MPWTDLDELVEQAKHLAAKLGEEWDEDLELILQFCFDTEDPALPLDMKSLRNYVSKYYKARGGAILPKELGTKPDPAVDWVLQSFYGMEENQCLSHSEAHRQSMQAENIIGALLERYVASGLRSEGWIWCCGSTAKHTDFINPGRRAALQVKNRSNSENAAGKSVRHGTAIQHWFRIDARTGATKWDLLPAPAGTFSESGFRDFIARYANEIVK